MLQILAFWTCALVTAGLWILAGASDLHAEEPEQSPDTRRWQCSLCPYREGWYGVLDFGLGAAGDSSPHYADYRGVDAKGAFPAIDGEVHFRNSEDRYFDMTTRDLGIDSRSLSLRGGVRGRYQWRLAYREIPKYRGDGTATVYLGAGGSNLTLPPAWQKSPTTAGMTLLNDSLLPTSLHTLRRTLEAGLTLKIGRKWHYDADFQHETREGTQPFGAGLFTINTSHFPAPVDFTTERFDMGLQYSGERTHLRLGFAGSWFDNGAASVTWENPFTSGPDNQRLQAALAPDNAYYQFSLQGVFAPRPGLRFSGRAAVGRMRQDDPFLPYSINPQFRDLALPRSDADARIDTGTLNIAGKLAARLSRRLNLSAGAKIDRRDNHTPVEVYTVVITDFVSGGDRLNRPYSFDREKYDIELSYRATTGVRLRAGSRFERYQRSLQSVFETDERLHWGEVNFDRWSVAQFRVKVENSTRDGSPYQQVDETGLIENPLMRKFNYADRNRNRAVVEADLSPYQDWSLNVSWSRAQDDYTESTVGLRTSEETSLGLNLGVSLSPRLSLYAYASRDDITSVLSGYDAATESPWNAYTDDRITTIGLGISGKMSKRLTLGLDWTDSISSGRMRVASDPGDAPFPVLRTRFGNVRGYVAYALNRHWAWKLAVEHESISSSDWQLGGLGPAGIANVLTLGGDSPHYHISTVRVQASYRF